MNRGWGLALGGTAFFVVSLTSCAPWDTTPDVSTPPALVAVAPQAAYTALNEAALPFDFGAVDGSDLPVYFSMERKPDQSLAWTVKIDNIAYLTVSVTIDAVAQHHSALDLRVTFPESPLSRDKSMSAEDFQILEAALDLRLTQFAASVVDGQPDTTNRDIFDGIGAKLGPKSIQINAVRKRVNAVLSKLLTPKEGVPMTRAEKGYGLVRFAAAPDKSQLETGPFLPSDYGSGLRHGDVRVEIPAKPSMSAAPMTDVGNGK